MYENMVDVLIYLYENYMDGENQPPTNEGELKDELTQAGFNSSEIQKALRWLGELATDTDVPHYCSSSGGSMRVYNDAEQAKLDLDSRGLLLFLEQSGILDPVSRELVIDRALAMDHNCVSVDELKWVVLLVLMNRPGQEAAFTQMEDLVYGEESDHLH
jgi:Smg protein